MKFKLRIKKIKRMIMIQYKKMNRQIDRNRSKKRTHQNHFKIFQLKNKSLQKKNNILLIIKPPSMNLLKKIKIHKQKEIRKKYRMTKKINLIQIQKLKIFK